MKYVKLSHNHLVSSALPKINFQAFVCFFWFLYTFLLSLEPKKVFTLNINSEVCGGFVDPSLWRISAQQTVCAAGGTT
jgi:hypothetical protein